MAGIKPLTGKEFFDNSIIQNESSYIFTVRYVSGITTKMRIKYGSRYFNIRAIINPDESAELLQLMGEEFVAI